MKLHINFVLTMQKWTERRKNERPKLEKDISEYNKM
jgi:hypothetical protein